MMTENPGEIYEVSKSVTDELRQRTWDACVEEGRAARRAGVGLGGCPPFFDRDMSVSWRIGWRRADEELRRR